MEISAEAVALTLQAAATRRGISEGNCPQRAL